MTVLDLINKSAIMLNIQEVLNDTSLATITSSNQDEMLNNNFALKRLYEFSKIVVNEISSYIPQVQEVEVEVVNKTIPSNTFERLSKIIGIKNEYGYVKYTIVDNCIKLLDNGKFVVVFNQSPQINGLLDEVELYSDELGEDILIYGLNAYYCLATGLFQEFNVYNAHYAQRLEKLKNIKVFAMPCRSWK